MNLKLVAVVSACLFVLCSAEGYQGNCKGHDGRQGMCRPAEDCHPGDIAGKCCHGKVCCDIADGDDECPGNECEFQGDKYTCSADGCQGNKELTDEFCCSAKNSKRVCCKVLDGKGKGK